MFLWPHQSILSISLTTSLAKGVELFFVAVEPTTFVPLVISDCDISCITSIGAFIMTHMR